MGYCASGDGNILVNEEAMEEVEALLEDCFEVFALDDVTYDGKSCVEFSLYHSGNYYDDNIYSCLNMVSGACDFLIGELYFTGEDGTHWRICYKNGTWEEENGTVLYSGDKYYVATKGGKPLKIFAEHNLPAAEEFCKIENARLVVCPMIL